MHERGTRVTQSLQGKIHKSQALLTRALIKTIFQILISLKLFVASLVISNYYIVLTAPSLFLILSNQNVQCGSVMGSYRTEANNHVLGSLDKTFSSQKICKMLKGQIDRAYEQTDFSILRSVFSSAQIRPKNVQINSILLQIHEAFQFG